jgi:hypothetical protein
MIFLLVMASACTAKRVPLKDVSLPAPEMAKNTDKAWYAARFSLNWEAGEEPKWYLGTLLGGEVINPLLAQAAQQLTYWRVHRRAVRDQTGHVFSFIFYSSEASAADIYQQLQSNKLLVLLQHQQELLKVSYDPLTTDLHRVIADTSDPVWPAEVRASWPLFMMGASQMWLAQIEMIKQETPEEQGVALRYKRIQEQVTELWQQQGQHALMHHLSALYAYQPVAIRF